MFIRLESTRNANWRYINTNSIREIVFSEGRQLSGNVKIVFTDDTVAEGFLPSGAIDHIYGAIIPAPDGYSNLTYIEPLDDEIGSLGTEPIVAFVVDPAADQLHPITAENGRLTTYAVRQPSGHIYTSEEQFFESEAAFLNYCRKTRRE